ncbi:hypothetical protein VNI00_010036 [Paramarasmius palmivorus]|uniref:Uncharacterized protein n=1 Tax=Paramarasmius palmivorus TaxID=297713 RepID=A0AAW0CMU2_9AGAR
MSVSELMEWKKGNTRTYFWSLDEDGHSKMSMEECRQWGVPELESWHAKGPLLFSWPSDVYTALRKWQVARGFDPSTTDFAQSLGFPELEILGANTNRNRDEVQFEVIDAGGETDSDLEWELVTS